MEQIVLRLEKFAAFERTWRARMRRPEKGRKGEEEGFRQARWYINQQKLAKQYINVTLQWFFTSFHAPEERIGANFLSVALYPHFTML